MYNEGIMPAVTYECKTSKLTKQHENKLKDIHRSMEKAMLGLTLEQRSIWIREQR